MNREIKFRLYNKTFEYMVSDQIIILGILKSIAQNKNIEDFVIMQYTGLKDKNCKEIYEGDIVSYLDTFKNKVQKGKVNFVDNGFYIIPYRDSDWTLHFDNTEKIEVIGNIYEEESNNE